mmetsp:Transcript_4234/g.11831  ORF Transcript_4234/g.11831 Transcript_4234/m.11831 type:complete len:224 (-) Transcript_4234:159-830(-)
MEYVTPRLRVDGPGERGAVPRRPQRPHGTSITALHRPPPELLADHRAGGAGRGGGKHGLGQGRSGRHGDPHPLRPGLARQALQVPPLLNQRNPPRYIFLSPAQQHLQPAAALLVTPQQIHAVPQQPFCHRTVLSLERQDNGYLFPDLPVRAALCPLQQQPHHLILTHHHSRRERCPQIVILHVHRHSVFQQPSRFLKGPPPNRRLQRTISVPVPLADTFRCHC